MSRYGFAAPSPSRTSSRVPSPRSGGTRSIALRLSRPQLARYGASVSGPSRLNALTVGLVSARERVRVLQHSRDHVLRGRGEPAPPSCMRFLPRGVDDGEVQVESAAALVGPRLAEEGRVLAGARDDVLDRGLEQERAVGGIQRVAVPQVDLVLRRAELVVAREHADVHAVEHAQQVQEGAVGVDHRAGRVDAPGAVDGAAPPTLVRSAM